MTCSKTRYEVTGSELIPKFAAPLPNAFEADFMRNLAVIDRVRRGEEYNYQRVTLPLLFSPSKEGSKNPTTAWS
ncbi:MAG: hypothetical protein DMF26_19940 [Verrucomicrobia bacterium]|nr:MAG: hypothetical protein DMF26_19940 [Verrucomicrobiota bacterium]